MESVSSYLVFLIIFIRKSVQVRFCRHGLMERSVKHANHRYSRHQLLTGMDTNQVGRIVKRRQIAALFDCLDGLFCNQGGCGKRLPSVDGAVAYRPYLVKTLDYSGICIGQSVQHHLDCLSMGGHRGNSYFLLSSCRLISDPASVNPYSLAKSLGQYCLRCGIDQLVF